VLRDIPNSNEVKIWTFEILCDLISMNHDGIVQHLMSFCCAIASLDHPLDFLKLKIIQVFTHNSYNLHLCTTRLTYYIQFNAF